MTEQLTFRISAALKNLIGKELITDEYVAVFELVKNSFDAYATKVEIIFENLYADNGNARLIIKDNGKGMNYDDLKNKWLFVAYSAKTDGTEDINYGKGKDYRDKIQESRVFAGAKGIGRFSCDRLGKKLDLITIKDGKNSKIEKLSVDWQNFEEDPKEEFVDIKVQHEELTSLQYGNFRKGTLLEIKELRDDWNRSKLLNLKHSLEKLINPSQENDARNFTIQIIAKDELLRDKDCKFERDKVNGVIENFLFETLDLKTTQIKTEIVDGAEFLKTELFDRGRLIYRIKEKNSFSLKSNVVIQLFALNRAAKLNFIKIMGLSSKKYGSIFLYKNGFRVYPFGEEGEDILKVDTRKQQGYNRYLGTRDLVGRIEINDKDNVDNLNESTSRDGGLIKNDKYDDLVTFFYDKALRRLEKYVVDLIKWGDPLEQLEGKSINPDDIKKEIIYLIANIAKDDDIVELEYDKKFLDIIDERKEENLPKNLKNFEKLVEKTDDPSLQKKARKIIKQFKEHQEALRETEQELVTVVAEKKEKETELNQRKSQVKFFQSILSRDYDQAINFLHHVGIIANTIDNHLENFNKKIQNKSHITKAEVAELINKLSYSAQRILSYTEFATKADYQIEEQFIEDDLKTFIYALLDDIVKKFYEKGIAININENTEDPFIKKFQPVNIKIVFDNLLNNSKKAKAKKININFVIAGSTLEIQYNDDGKGLSDEIKNPEDIFEQGVTTTKGSGLGLYHTRQVLKEENGSIHLGKEIKNGMSFLIKVKK